MARGECFQSSTRDSVDLDTRRAIGAVLGRALRHPCLAVKTGGVCYARLGASPFGNLIIKCVVNIEVVYAASSDSFL